MKLLKSYIVVLSLALSSGFFSSTVYAIDLEMPAHPLEGINLVLGHLEEAKKAVAAGESADVIREHIQAALRISKEISGKEQLDRNRLKAGRYLKRAKSAAKKGDTDETNKQLDEGIKRFTDLKSWI